MATLAVGMAGATGVAGCSSSGPSTATDTTSVRTAVPTASASLSMAQRADRAALATYAGMWSDVVTAYRTSNSADPRLADHMTGQALTLWTNGLKSENAKSYVTSQGAPVLHPVVTSATPAANPTQVVIHDCVDTRTWLERHRDGSLVDNVPGGNRLVQALVTMDGGEWKVSRLVVEALGTC